MRVLRDKDIMHTDLRDTTFCNTDLTRSKIENSHLSGAKFLGNKIKLRAVQVKSSYLAGAKFSPKAKFRCTLEKRKCAQLKQSDFSLTTMVDVLFRGAEVEQVDFTGANLHRADFDCDRVMGYVTKCTVLKNLCLQDADFTGATFKGKSENERIKISNIDFSSADFTDAEFENVEFKNVVFPEKLQKSVKKFDDVSRDSLKEAKTETLYIEKGQEIPCTEEWRKELTEWMGPFSPHISPILPYSSKQAECC